MFSTHRWLSCTALLIAACILTQYAVSDEGAKTPPAKANTDFARDVLPILQKNCVECHGEELQMGELRLDRRDDAMQVIEPGNIDDSLLIQRLVDKELGLLMPPIFQVLPSDRGGLEDKQIKALRSWIEAGASWPEGVTVPPAPQEISADVNVRKLFAAIRAGDEDVAKMLLANRSLIGATDRHGSTPLMLAAIYSDADIISLFLEKGASVDHKNENGATALMWSAGDIKKVRLLLEKGADANAKSDLGRTPLLIATTYAGNLDVVRLLLERGADISARDNYKETVLSTAAKRHDVILLRFLIEKGADVKAESNRSALVWAASEGNAESVKLLLAHGAGKNRRQLNKALFKAAMYGPADKVRLLLEHDADPNAAVGYGGYSPLMGAAYSDGLDPEIVRLLLAAGGDVTKKAANGKTVLTLARDRGNKQIIQLLTEAGAKQ